MSAASNQPDGGLAAQSGDDSVYRKITWRFVPLLFICYVINYMSRTSIGFAQLQMKGELGFTDIVYGIGAGSFFVSYALFALPSNMIMAKLGARKTMFACMFSCGLVSFGAIYIHTRFEFYLMNFLLGAVTAGYLPGIIFYFTKWFPSHRRAEVTGIFLSATAFSGVVSGLQAGALINYMNGYWGQRGWQWMFSTNGLESALAAIFILFILDDSPERAKWLSDGEKKTILDALAKDKKAASGRTLGQALANWRVYLLAFIFFVTVGSTYVLAYWQPQIIKELGYKTAMTIGLLSVIPSIAAVVGKIYIGRHSDKKKELRWHFAVPAFVGAVGFMLMPLIVHNPILAVLFLAVATAGAHSTIPIFWSVPGLFWTGTAAGGAIAIITTLGNTSGVVGPPLMGWIKTSTGGFAMGMYSMGALLALGGLLMFALVSRKRQAALKGQQSASEKSPQEAVENQPA